MAIDKIQELINMYQKNPGIFTEREVGELQQLAQSYGYPFQPKSSALRKLGIFAGEAADTALLGAIPNEAKLQARTSGESYASMAGEVAGIATPGGLPSMLGTKAANLAARGTGKLAQLASKGFGAAPTQAQIGSGGLKALRGIQDVGKYGSVRLQQGTKLAAENMKKFGLNKQAKSFTQFMNKQAKGLEGFKGFGRAQNVVEGVTSSPMLQQGIVGGARFGTQLAAGNLAENVAGGNFDQIIADFMGGASVGAIGGFLSQMPAKNKLFNIRNLTAGIVAYSAGQGIPVQEDRVYARLLTLAGLATGGRIPKVGIQ